MSRRDREREESERRVPPPHRDIVLSPEDRELARVIVNEITKHLGITDLEGWREDRSLLETIMPMLKTMHESFKLRRALYQWWLSMAGKGVLTIATFVVLTAFAYGLFPAIRLTIDRLLVVGP